MAGYLPLPCALQGLLVDLEVARSGKQRRKMRMVVVDAAGADRPITDPAVPRLEELLARMPPGARDEQLELDRTESALAAVLLGEGDEGAADAGAAVIGGRDQHPELAHVIRDVVKPDAAGDLAVPGGDRDLFRADQLGELGRRRPWGPVAPKPALGGRVHVVDEAGHVIDEPGIVVDRPPQQADGDRGRLLVVRAHGSRMAAEIERCNT
jgi:hypothetical protein